MALTSIFMLLLSIVKMAIKGCILKYIENLRTTHNLNWSALIHSMIFENIDACHSGVVLREENGGKIDAYFFGCVVVLNVSFFCWFKLNLDSNKI